MNRFSLVIFLLLLAPRLGTAQAGAGDEAPQDYWIDVFYPKLFFSGRDGFTAGGFFGFMQPIRFMDFDTPPPYRAQVSIDAQHSVSGSRFVTLAARAPAYVDGWRFVGILEARREAREAYFGVGNDTQFESDSITDEQPHFYQALHTRFTARVEVQRRIIGNLRMLAGVDVQRWRLATLSGNSVLAGDLTSGVDPTLGRFNTDISGRVGLVYDTRNDEIFAERGVLLQAIASGASADVAGDLSYSRFTASAQGYLTPTPRLVLTGRMLTQVMGGTPRFGTYYLVDGSDRQFTGLGGGTSHRALDDNRFLGRHKLLANLEARFALYAIPTLIRVSLVGFVDAGRVFEQEDFRFTFDDLKVGGGTGLFVQVGRAAIAGFTSGVGPEGLSFDFHTRWPF